jgi:hypothetical protein
MLIVITPEVETALLAVSQQTRRRPFVQKLYWTCDLRSLHWLMRIGGAVR